MPLKIGGMTNCVDKFVYYIIFKIIDVQSFCHFYIIAVLRTL